MLRYPLLDKFNPQCPQDLKCSLIVDACARTISAWIAAAILLPSSSDRPSVSGTAQSSLSIRATSISVAGPPVGRFEAPIREAPVPAVNDETGPEQSIAQGPGGRSHRTEHQ